MIKNKRIKKRHINIAKNVIPMDTTKIWDVKPRTGEYYEKLNGTSILGVK